MKALIKFIKLNNFKSFNGAVTVGPLDEFTVLIGYNSFGKCDLMDAVDFVFGVYDLKHSDDRQPIECSVTAIVENSSGVQLTWKRRLLNDDDLDTSISEYEYNGLPVDWPTYNGKLQLLHIDSKAVPIVLDPDTLTTMFQLDKQGLLRHLEQVCGSFAFAEPCATLSAQMMALRAKCKQQHEVICVINRKQINVRKHCMEYNKLKALKKSLDLLRNYLDLRTLEQLIADNAAQVRFAKQGLLQADDLIDKNRRESIDFTRRSSVIKQRLSVAPPALAENRVDLVFDAKVAVQNQQIEHNEQILAYINDQIHFFEELAQNPPSAEGAPPDFMALENEKLDQHSNIFDELLESLPDPDQFTPSQQRVANALNANFNAHVRYRCDDAMRTRSPAASDRELRIAERLHAGHTLSTWKTMLQHCDTLNDRIRTKLTEIGGVHVLDTMHNEQPYEAAVSFLLNDFESSMICQDADTAERCAAEIRANAVTVSTHGFNTLQISNGMNESVTQEMPRVANARNIQEAIVLVPGVDIQLDTYLANVVRAVVCEPRHVRSIVAEHGVTAISTYGVTMNARGGMDAHAIGGGEVAIDPIDERRASSEDFTMNAADYELVTAPIADGEDPRDGAASTAGMVEMAGTFHSHWEVIALQAASQIDCAAVMAILETARDTCLTALTPLKVQFTELKQYFSDSVAVEKLAGELKNNEFTMKTLLERKATASATIAECQAKLAANQEEMLKILLQLKIKNTPIAMRRGTIDLLREDDPESLDLIEIDYSSIDRTRSPESLAKYERLLQTATNEFQRVSHRHTLLETLPRLADHRRDMERTLQATQMQLNHTLSLYQVKLADRTQRFRPFYAYLRNILPETYAQLYQNELAQTYILPERSEETGGGGHDDDVSIAEALSDGIVLDFIPPNRRYRRKSMWPLAEQLMAALAVMFTVYAFTRQPFVFVHQFDRLLDGIEPRLKELLVDFLVAQSNGRMQIVLASDRPEMFQRAGSVVGIVLKGEYESSSVHFNDE